MADPFTMAAIGATAGALTNKDDPLKGALMGGALGYGGGTLMAGGSGAAAATGAYDAGIGLNAMTGGAPVLESASLGSMGGAPISAYNIPFDPAAYQQFSGLQGATQGATDLLGAVGGGGQMGPMQKYMAMNAASGLLGGGQQPRSGGVAMAPMQRGQYQPVMTPQSLLATQMDMRRRQPYSFA